MSNDEHPKKPSVVSGNVSNADGSCKPSKGGKKKLQSGELLAAEIAEEAKKDIAMSDASNKGVNVSQTVFGDDAHGVSHKHTERVLKSGLHQNQASIDA